MKDNSHKQKKELRLKLILFGVPAVSISVSVLLYILYGHRYNILSRLMLYILAALTFIAMFIIYLKYSKSVAWNKRKQFFITTLVLTVFISFTYGVFELKKSYDTYQLKTYGKKVFAKITGYETTYRKRRKIDYATIQYTVDRKVYTERISNDDFLYKTGDELELLVSEKDPELFRILALVGDY